MTRKSIYLILFLSACGQEVIEDIDAAPPEADANACAAVDCKDPAIEKEPFWRCCLPDGGN